LLQDNPRRIQANAFRAVRPEQQAKARNSSLSVPYLLDIAFEVECSEIGQWSFYGLDLAPLQARADDLRAGARRVDAERRWLRELRYQILCLSTEVRKGHDILQGQAGPENASALTPLVNDDEALLKRGSSRSLPLDQAQALVDGWADLAARLNGHRSMADECAEGIEAELLPSSTIEAVEPFMTNGRCDDRSVDEVGILALVNGNLPVVGETIGRAQIQGEDATSGRWKIKNPNAYLLSLSERVRQRDDIISWIEGLHRRSRH
jgi:hypothetical protein